MSLLIEALRQEVQTDQNNRLSWSDDTYSDQPSYTDEAGSTTHWNDMGHHSDNWSDDSGSPIHTDW